MRVGGSVPPANRCGQAGGSWHNGQVITSAPLPSVAGIPVAPPVVLAPMAGITNQAFRALCRAAIPAGPEPGSALFVSEMITSRALLERHEDTMAMVRFGADELPRSLQLYGVDPAIVAAAVKMVVAEDLADHIDLNFGCPVPKVTRKGGGSALPWKRDLFRRVVAAAVGAADGRVPVTVKMRMGIDAEHLTYLDAGLAAADEGVAWVALHGRTAAQMYGGAADWDAVAELVAALAGTGVAVLGNGDIWTHQDALAMVASTGCAGVVVGRGCLGRPWLFGQLAAAFRGDPVPPDPDSAAVLAVLRQHAALLVQMHDSQAKGCRDIRKHIAWYLKGFRVGSEVRAALGTVASLGELDALLARIDPDQPFPTGPAGGPRGRTTSTRRVALPDGWLDSQLLAGAVDLSEAEICASGG